MIRVAARADLGDRRRGRPPHRPGYVRIVDALDIWKVKSSGAPGSLLRLKAPLEETWLPYLAGSGTRDEATAALLSGISARP
jgi:hypothetical protein